MPNSSPELARGTEVSLLGVFVRSSAARVDLDGLKQALGPNDSVAVWAGGRLGLGAAVAPLHDEARDRTLLLVGEAFGRDDPQQDFAHAALTQYERDGVDFAARFSGRFAFALWDGRRERLVLGRDPFGEAPLYLHEDGERIVFSTAIEPILRVAGLPRELDPGALGRYLLFNYNPGVTTLLRGVRRLRPGHVLVADRDAPAAVRCYWRPSFREVSSVGEAEIAHELRERLERAVTTRLGAPGRTGLFLSGGMDSSTVLAMAHRSSTQPLRTFSYSCRRESFDESSYARVMASSLQTEHTELEYPAAAVLRLPEIVRGMNEPFCDIGINIATFLLGCGAEGRVDSVLTGDGGDELFGGHPVYEADKLARFVDPWPAALKVPLLRLGRALPDSEKKKTLVVKIKRFAESLSMPASLLSNRWRIYYGPQELAELCVGSGPGSVANSDPLSEVLAYAEEADGRDLLSRALYCDYQTVVDFYLRRNDLIRRFGIDVRHPLLDRELVEFCATIPSTLKIKGWFDTKYILRLAVRDLLPPRIVDRKDKLGHSVPMKIWMRDEPAVRTFVLDHLSPDTVRRRGLFRPAAVERMVEDHLARRRNNSHRLWTLLVLELWMRQFVDPR